MVKQLLTEKRVFNFVCILLTMYLVLRAIFVPIVLDESTTFLYYIFTGNLTGETAMLDANNHYLNSLLAHWLTELFGNSPLVVRLPNLLFFPLFCFFVWKIGQYIKLKGLRIGFYIVFLFTHNFIEFFALSRGYGMSIAMILGATYYTIRFLEDRYRIQLVLALIYCSSSLSSNLNMTLSVLVLEGLLLLAFIHTRKFGWLSALLTFFFLGIAPLIYWVDHGLALKDANLLYYGTDTGLIGGTANSVIEFLFGATYGLNAFIRWSLVLLFIVSILLLLSTLRKNVFHSFFQLSNIWAFLIIGNCVALLILGNYLDSLYPLDRTAMHLFLMLIASFLFLLDQHGQKWLNYLAFPIVLIPIHFMINMNISHSSLWDMDQSIPSKFHELIAEKSKNSNLLPSIGGSYFLPRPWSYEVIRFNSKLSLLRRTELNRMNQFLILSEKEAKEYAPRYTVLHSDEVSGQVLLELKNRINYVELSKSEINKEKSEGEYMRVLSSSVDSTQLHKSVLLDLDVHLTTDLPIADLQLSIKSETTDGQFELIDQIGLIEIPSQKIQDGIIHYKTSLALPITTKPCNIIVFLWNPKSLPIQLTANNSVIMIED